MEIRTTVDTTTVTFVVDDTSKVPFQQRVVTDGAQWVKEARTRITRAINYSTKALVTPDAVAPAYWDLLHFYFGIPVKKTTPGEYVIAINEILKRLSFTMIGMGGDLTIADLSQMPGIAKAQLNCMNAISKLTGKETGEMAGLVFVDVLEYTSRFFTSLWKSSPSGVSLNPFAGPIHLNFEELWKHGDRSGVVTLIHEATHKFSQTTDEQYFPDTSAWDTFEKAMESCRPMVGVMYKTFDEFLDGARKIALMGELGVAVNKVASIDRMKSLNNADGVANYAYEVADFSTEEELSKAIKALLGNKK